MKKALDIGTMERPFPAGSVLGAWFDEWIVSLNTTKKTYHVHSQLFRNLQDRLSQNTKRWTRLAKGLVIMVLKLPAIFCGKLESVALEIKRTYTQEFLLAKNINTQIA